MFTFLFTSMFTWITRALRGDDREMIIVKM